MFALPVATAQSCSFSLKHVYWTISVFTGLPKNLAYNVDSFVSLSRRLPKSARSE